MNYQAGQRVQYLGKGWHVLSVDLQNQKVTLTDRILDFKNQHASMAEVSFEQLENATGAPTVKVERGIKPDPGSNTQRNIDAMMQRLRDQGVPDSDATKKIIETVANEASKLMEGFAVGMEQVGSQAGMSSDSAYRVVDSWSDFIIKYGDVVGDAAAQVENEAIEQQNKQRQNIVEFFINGKAFDDWSKFDATKLPPSAGVLDAAESKQERINQRFKANSCYGWSVLWEVSNDGTITDDDLIEYGAERAADVCADAEACWDFVDYLNDSEEGIPLAIRHDLKVVYYLDNGRWMRNYDEFDPVPEDRNPPAEIDVRSLSAWGNNEQVMTDPWLLSFPLYIRETTHFVTALQRHMGEPMTENLRAQIIGEVSAAAKAEAEARQEKK